MVLSDMVVLSENFELKIPFAGWHGQTALHKACLCGDWSVTYLLLEGGSDPNAQNDFDETPLHYSCKRGLAQIVHLIVQKGGNLEAVDKNGKTAAHHAAQTGSVLVFISPVC